MNVLRIETSLGGKDRKKAWLASPLSISMISMSINSIVLFCMMLAPSSWASTLRVPSQWPTIQGAMVASQNGDTVLVAAGSHAGPVDFLGKAVVLRSQDGASQCSIVTSQPGASVRFGGGEGPDSILEGFTLTGGVGSLESGPCGGAILVDAASPLIRHCHLLDNQAVAGGAICLLNSGATLESLVFSGNQSELGGAVYLEGGAPRLLGCLFVDNLATGAAYGGALAMNASAATVEASVFVGNQARLGGAMAGLGSGESSSADSLITLRGNSLCGNQAQFGGGLYLRACQPTVEANVLAFSPVGAALWCQSAQPRLRCNLLFGNEAGNDLCGEDEGDNRVEDPLFCDAAAGDLRLQAGSPCWTSPCGIIGAYAVNCDGVAVAPLMRPVSPRMQVELAPNPFNPSTQVTVELPQAGEVQVRCFDVLGRLERTVYQGHRPAGRQSFQLEGQGLAAGVHLVQIQVGDQRVALRALYLP